MKPIRPLDLVRLRHTPEWTALVRVTEDELALITHQVPGGYCSAWLPLDLLELVPGQIETLAA